MLHFTHLCKYLIGGGDIVSANRVASLPLVVGVYDQSDSRGKNVDEKHQQNAYVQRAKNIHSPPLYIQSINQSINDLFTGLIIITSPAQSNLERAASQCSHWLQWDAPNSPHTCPFYFDDHHPHLIHPSLDRPHSPSQTVSGSTQPFCHNTLCGQTDRPTCSVT